MKLRLSRNCSSIKARWGSQANTVDWNGADGRVGEYERSVAKRCQQARMVLRSSRVTRSVFRWLVPVSSSVNMVVCRCGSKTFNPVSLRARGGEDNALPITGQGGEKTGINPSAHPAHGEGA